MACPKQKQDAVTVARELVIHKILKMDTLRTLLTDEGTNLMSENLRSVCKVL
jgi:hypothetical protein